MRKRRGIRRVLSYTVVPATIVVTGAFVSASSYSVFSDNTTSPNNSFTAGTVTLQSDGSSGGASGTAMFTADVSPGSTGTKCITVTSTGTTPADVKLYGANLSQTKALADHLTLTVRVGTATSTTGGACTGFSPTATVFPAGHLSSFPTGGWANALDTTWSPTGTGNESRAFEFTYTMDTTAPSSAQGGTAHVDFVWEARTAA